MAKFRNPQNDYIEVGGTMLSWLWTLLFGPIYFAVRGVWSHAVGYILIAMLVALTGPVAVIFLPALWIIYAALSAAIIDRSYKRKGWIEMVS